MVGSRPHLIPAFAILATLQFSGARGCCQNVSLTSTGSLATGLQNHIIGTYLFDSTGPDERMVYRQVEHWRKYLHYTKDFRRWVFSDDPDNASAYAWFEDDALCAEDLGGNLQWWDFDGTETMVDDPTASINCISRGCCKSVSLTSTGSLATGLQNHIIGTYLFDSMGPDERMVYRQVEHWRKYLHYNKYFRRWIFSDDPDNAEAYAWFEDDALCADDLGGNLQWWDFDGTQTMVDDPTASINCI